MFIDNIKYPAAMLGMALALVLIASCGVDGADTSEKIWFGNVSKVSIDDARAQCQEVDLDNCGRLTNRQWCYRGELRPSGRLEKHTPYLCVVQAENSHSLR